MWTVVLGQRNYGREAMNLAGERSVAVGIYQRDGANALEVSRAIKRKLKQLEASFPLGIEVSMIVDVADTVQANLDRTFITLRDAVLLVLVVLVLLWPLASRPDPSALPCRWRWWKPQPGETERFQSQQPDPVWPGAGHRDRCG